MQISERQIINFWKKVKKTDSCWLWTASKTKAGYGRFNICGKSFLAHRVSLMLTGSLPLKRNNIGAGGVNVLHRCDNPTCVNPKHLRLGTQRENVADAIIKERHYFPNWVGKNNPNFGGVLSSRK